MRKFHLLILLYLTFISSIHAYEWAPFKNLISTEEGLICYYYEKGITYLVLVDPESGDVTRYWEVDKNSPFSSNGYSNRNLIAEYEGDLILGDNYISVYRDDQDQGLTRISLEGDTVEEVWNNRYIDIFDEEFFVLGNLAMTVERRGSGDSINSVYEIDLDTGDYSNRKVPDVRTLRLGPQGMITSDIDRSNLQYRDFQGKEIWSLDTSRINFEEVYLVDGFVLLSEPQDAQLYCLDESGNKLWKIGYSNSFPKYGFFGARIGEYILISDPEMVTFVEVDSGNIILNLVGGLEKIPFFLNGNVLIRGISNRGFLQEYEVLNLETLRIKSTIDLSSLGVEGQREYSVPTQDLRTGFVYISLKDNRLIGIDPEDGGIVFDRMLELPAESGW